MEQSPQKQKNIFAWLALIFGCICFACLLFFLFTCFIGWSEWHPLAVMLFITFGCSLIAGPFSAILSVVFGCIVRFWKRKEGGGLSRRQEVFSNLAIAGGALYIVVVPILFVFA